MKFRSLLFSLAAITLLVVTPCLAENKTVDHLQNISVTIRAESGGMFGGVGQGSGTLVTRKVGNETVTFVWTCAHVVDNLRNVRTVTINGVPKVVVEFKDAAIVQEFKQNGRRIGEIKMDAQVIRYSDADTGEDLALLRVRKTNFQPDGTGAKFYLDSEIPAIGSELYHVGSLLGQFGSNSLTTGVISQHGRVLNLSGSNGVVFDQTTATAFPGSSGGGVFLKDGRYVGMVVRGAGEGFNFIVPVRRMHDWSKKTGIEWAINPAIPVPSEAELSKLPVEDTGVEFTPAAEKTGPSGMVMHTFEIWKANKSDK